jgi:hypothetical protein
MHNQMRNLGHSNATTTHAFMKARCDCVRGTRGKSGRQTVLRSGLLLFSLGWNEKVMDPQKPLD